MNAHTFQRTKPGVLLQLVFAALIVWFLAQLVLRDSIYLLIYAVMCVSAICLVQIWKNWRTGILIFLVWMLFEDLVRKYMGNNMLIYFAKDVLAVTCCLSFFASRRSERILGRPPSFFLPLGLFFLWVVLEMLNPNSPSIFYGLMGLMLYFFYVPLFFLGYALLRSEVDLQRFLLVNLTVAGVIAALGVAQGITGRAMLAPAELAPEIRELGTLGRTAPITHEHFIRPVSVFVSDGRFGAFMGLTWLLGFGAVAYFFLGRLRGRLWILSIMGMVMAAIVLSGSRSTLIASIISAFVMPCAYLPELRSRVRAGRLIWSLIAIMIFGVFSATYIMATNPDALNARLAFYTQTLSPSSPSSVLNFRMFGYPTQEFLKAFSFPNWVWGNGTGTASLGGQYITGIVGASPSAAGVESGYGNLLLELGIPGLALWLFWTAALVRSGWGILRSLRRTSVFPVGFSIYWFAVVLLFVSTATGLTGYENFVVNSYLWLLLGILYSLPAILDRASIPPRSNRIGLSPDAAGLQG